MTDLSAGDIEDVREVFDLFDFWDGRDGLVDGVKIGDVMRCIGLNPTQKQILDNGGTKKIGEKQYKFEEILPIYRAVSAETDVGTFADFMEAFKTFDREGLGLVNAAELRQILIMMGERVTDSEVDHIFKFTGTEEDLDGNLKFEELIKKVMAGPDMKAK
jgi:Ca2+-binding EF-hand superfamily protein